VHVDTAAVHLQASPQAPKEARQRPWGAGGGALNTVERGAMYKGVEQECQQG